MNNKIKISPIQLTALTFFLHFPVIIATLGTILADLTHQDSWIVILIAFILGLIPLIVFISISKLLGEYDLITFIEIKKGKINKFILWIYLLFFIIELLFILNSISSFIVNSFNLEMPRLIIVSLIMIVAIYSSRKGIEVIARSGEFLLPIWLLVFFILIGFLVPDMDLQRVKPYFETPLLSIFYASLIVISSTTLTLSLILLIPRDSLSKPEDYQRNIVYGYILSNVIIFIITMTELLILGPNLTSLYQFPLIEIFFNNASGVLITRFDVFIFILWFVTSVMQVILIFYFITYSLSKLFRHTHKQIYSFPLAILLLAIVPNIKSSLIDQNLWNIYGETLFKLLFLFMIPLVSLFLLRRKYLKTTKEH